MKEAKRVREQLCEMFDQYAQKGRMSGSDIEMIWKLTDTIKNIDKIEMLERGGYSGDDSFDGYSGAHYVRGHYSRDGYSGREGYAAYDAGISNSSYRGGYSRDKESMKEQLEHMMREAEPREKEAIRKCLEQIR